MKRNQLNQRLEEITPKTLVVGIDVAKSLQWARFVDYRGVEVAKTMSFKNDKIGFENIVSEIKKICKSGFENVVIGMEPTGHYWKTLANYLINRGYKVVGVNPYHTKRAKELDDNSPTKCDKKDAITIARLVKDGRYFIPYLPQDIYAELRALTNARTSLMKRNNAIKNTVVAVLDEYFPEITQVFKYVLNGKASRQILKSYPFPSEIIAIGTDGVLKEIKKAVKKSVGIKKAEQLVEIARNSIGVEYGLVSTKIKLQGMLAELELLEKNLENVENMMGKMLMKTGYGEQILSIKGIGIVTGSMFLGEVGNPLRFNNARQISKLAGYDLVEDSSGKNKSGTVISKRGRKGFRSVLYQMAFTMVGKNPEMKELYRHLLIRKKNPLKKKQALVVISKKIITIIYSLIKKQEKYKPDRVFGAVRQEMLLAA